MIDIMKIIEAGIDQEKGHLHEIIIAVEIEVQLTVDLGQDPELVQMGIGQEIAPVLEKRETWNNCNKS